jgi:hypothetical protein
MSNKTKIFLIAQRNSLMGSIDLSGSFDIAGDNEHVLAFTKPTVRKAHVLECTSPFLRLSRENATALMDSLWRAGVRPTEVGSAGELAATKYHLEDMRSIVGVKLNNRGEKQ